MLKISLGAAIAAVALCSAAHATTVTSFGATSGWYAYESNPGTISTDQPRSGNGSAKLAIGTSGSATAPNSQKSVVGYYGGGLGTLAQLTTLAFDYYRDSSSTDGAQFAPTFKLYVQNTAANGGGKASLTWELAQQNGATAAPVDQWISDTSLLNELFFINSGGLNYNNAGGPSTIAGFAGGYQATNGGSTSLKLYGDTVITALELGAGSGWGDGTFTGYVDNATIGTTGGAGVSANFESNAPSAVPLPAAGWAGIALLGKLGLTRRRV